MVNVEEVEETGDEDVVGSLEVTDTLDVVGEEVPVDVEGMEDDDDDG
jgi:hypothetical protein